MGTAMGRKHTFYDSEQRNRDWDPNDTGLFVPNTVFVGMGFSSPENKATYNTIVSACNALNLKARRVDESVGSGLIHLQIKDEIEKAEFCVFDLTDERPNVYYELGYAHGVGNEANDILLIAKQSTVLHFDVAPLRVNYYSSVADLGETVKDRLARMIQATRS
jgi:hypothetical protein